MKSSAVRYHCIGRRSRTAFSTSWSPRSASRIGSETKKEKGTFSIHKNNLECPFILLLYPFILLPFILLPDAANYCCTALREMIRVLLPPPQARGRRLQE